MGGQTTVTQDPIAALEGMLEGSGPYATFSRVLTDAAGIGAGRFVRNDTTDIGNSCAAFTAQGDYANALGVTVRNFAKMPTTPFYAQQEDISILYDGLIWMTCVDDMRTVTGVCHVVTSGANAGLPQLSAVGADLAVGLKCVKGGNVGLVGLFRVLLVAQ
jgi:hypothetical protein